MRAKNQKAMNSEIIQKKTMGKETKLGKINIYTKHRETGQAGERKRGRQRKVTRVKKMTSNEQVEHGPEPERK